MKIAFIVDTEITKDPRVLNEAKMLSEYGHKVCVLCPDLFNMGHKTEVNGIEISRFRLSNRQKEILFAFVNRIPLYFHIWKKHIKKFITDNKPDYLHAHDLYMAKPVYEANKKYKLPISLDLHENFPAAIMSYSWANKFPHRLIVAPKKWKKKEERYLSYADNIIVLCDSFRDDILSRFPQLKSKNFISYPNVPDVNSLLEYHKSSQTIAKKDEFVIFYFGVIGYRRGIITCFEALKKAVKKYSNIKLLLIGPIDKADRDLFYSYMNNDSIKNNVEYHSWKDMSEFPAYVNYSDIGISPLIRNPQHDSGIANKVFQYMLFKKPILVSDCKPQEDLVNTTKSGLVFRNQDVDDLYEKIIYMYEHPKEMKSMGENGKNAVISQYNMVSAAKVLNSLYR